MKFSTLSVLKNITNVVITLNYIVFVVTEKKNIANKALNSPTSTPKLIEEENPAWKNKLIRENDFRLSENKKESTPNGNKNYCTM